jgi:hypothetical protein
MMLAIQKAAPIPDGWALPAIHEREPCGQEERVGPPEGDH